MKNMVVLLITFATLGAFGRPPVEYVNRWGIELQSNIANEKATDAEIDLLASPLFEKFLSKSSFSDLKIDKMEVTDSNHNGSLGWRFYSFELSDKDSNRFTGLLSLQFNVTTLEDPRNGKITNELRAFVALSTRLRNFKKYIILEAKG